MSDLQARIETLRQRLRTSYDGIGHSSGRPYVYFVYPPDQERAMRRLVDETLRDEATLAYHQIDLLPLAIKSLEGQEERRAQLLNDARQGGDAAGSILRLWSRYAARAIHKSLEDAPPTGRPVAVLRGLAALHPLGTPTGMMEEMAEKEVRDPRTDRIVPVVLLVPGVRPPQTSRRYWFLGQQRLECDFYRGEEA